MPKQRIQSHVTAPDGEITVIHFRSSRPLIALAVISSCLAVSGCAGVVIGAGASAGVAASEERGFGGAVDDTKIKASINDAWFKKDAEMFRKCSTTISEGRVLLTGIVPTQENRDDAARLAWQAEGVREVYNEILVRPSGSKTIDDGRDVWISQELKGKLLFDKYVRNINYNWDVVDGVIYLIGIAQSDAELQRVIAHARDISNVRSVVNYVRLKNDTRRIGQ